MICPECGIWSSSGLHVCPEEWEVAVCGLQRGKVRALDAVGAAMRWRQLSQREDPLAGADDQEVAVRRASGGGHWRHFRTGRVVEVDFNAVEIEEPASWRVTP